MTHIDLQTMVWFVAIAAVARAVFFPWTGRSQLNDPLTAIIGSVIGGIGEAAAAVAPEALAGAGFGAADVAAGAAGLGALDAAAGTGIALAPEAVLGGAGEAGLLASAGIGPATAAELGAGGLAAASGAAGGGGGLADIAGAVAPALSGTEALSGVPGVAGAASTSGAVPGLVAPVSGASTLTGVAPAGAGAAVPGAVLPPAEFSGAIEPLAGSATDLSATSGAAGTGGGAAGAGGTATATGPVAGTAANLTDLGISPSTQATWAGLSPQGQDAALNAAFNSPATNVLDTSSTAAGEGVSAADAAKGAGGIGSFLKDNKEILGLAGSALPLLFNMFKKQPGLPAENTASQLVGSTAGAAQALQSSAVNGVLPQGYEEAILRAKQSGEAAIKSRYYQAGQTGSTSEAMDIAANNAKVDLQRAQLLDQLTTQGIAAAGTAGGQALDLAKLQLTQDQEFQQALGRLSSALVLSTLPGKATSALTA